LFLLAAAGIGLLVSAVVTTMQQALLASFLLVMPFTLLSGLLTPLSSMPEALQQFSLINPLRYMIDIAQRVYLEGVGVDRLAFDLLPLAATAVLTLSIGGFVFRWRLG
jgi:ABC-2 type transport system permease protein